MTNPVVMADVSEKSRQHRRRHFEKDTDKFAAKSCFSFKIVQLFRVVLGLLLFPSEFLSFVVMSGNHTYPASPQRTYYSLNSI